MRKLKTRFIGFILTFIMVFSTITTAFAQGTSNVSTESTSIVIEDNGMYINDTYFSKDEFISLLDEVVDLEIPQTRSILAGAWFIPGVGQVLVTAAGVVLVGGAVVSGGTWLYKTISDWFKDRAIVRAYEEDKQAGRPTDNHSIEVGKRLSRKGRPNSSKDLIDDGLKQRRYYDKNGDADMDIDYHHGNGNNSHTFPHRHYWDGTNRV